MNMGKKVSVAGRWQRGPSNDPNYPVPGPSITFIHLSITAIQFEENIRESRKIKVNQSELNQINPDKGVGVYSFSVQSPHGHASVLKGICGV